ncbi:hypothetical protein GCM10010431_81570 [Streptomyces kunmingensis]
MAAVACWAATAWPAPESPTVPAAIATAWDTLRLLITSFLSSLGGTYMTHTRRT